MLMGWFNRIHDREFISFVSLGLKEKSIDSSIEIPAAAKGYDELPPSNNRSEIDTDFHLAGSSSNDYCML